MVDETLILRKLGELDEYYRQIPLIFTRTVWTAMQFL